MPGNQQYRDTSILILEDDPFIAADIQDVCRGLGFEVVGVFHQPDQALAYDGELDLAILDINLNAPLSGIEVAAELQAKFGCEHMFVTSYFDERTVQKAGETQPLAYITKPFEEKDLTSNLLLAHAKLCRSRAAASEPSNKKTEVAPHIFIKTTKALLQLDPLSVDFLQAYDIYAKIHQQGEVKVASHSLKQLEPVFEPYGFLRIHRSYMVNLARIQRIQEDEVYISGTRIPVGRAYKTKLHESITVI